MLDLLVSSIGIPSEQTNVGETPTDAAHEARASHELENILKMERIIDLELFRQASKEVAAGIVSKIFDSYFDNAGLSPADQDFRYDSTPINTTIFARTGGDGVHYSLLELSESIQPVIMTVPMNSSNQMDSYNWILAENLNEFLSIGYYHGWFPLEQICYQKNWIEIYNSKESFGQDYLPEEDLLFIKGLRERLGYSHMPLSKKRLDFLKESYFDKLIFDSEFLDFF